jgi:hypothetical protein
MFVEAQKKRMKDVNQMDAVHTTISPKYQVNAGTWGWKEMAHASWRMLHSWPFTMLVHNARSDTRAP